MSYLEPPPAPAPVIVMKDVGGYVNLYQAQTEIYRASGQEVRLHECRSACTLALSLPNVCVYQDSMLKFHLAYDPRDKRANHEVSRRLFMSYPPAVRERLGGLTRSYKSLRGSELIALGVRDCAAPRPAPDLPLAAAAPARLKPPGRDVSLFGGLMSNMASMLSSVGAAVAGAPGRRPEGGVEAARREAVAPTAAAPLPPARSQEIGARDEPKSDELKIEARPSETRHAAEPPRSAEGPERVASPEPPQRPRRFELSYASGAQKAGAGWAVIDGAQPILPPRFVAYAQVAWRGTFSDEEEQGL